MSQHSYQVQIENETATPLVVVYGGGELGVALSGVLEKQHLRVRQLEESEALPVLEHPAYVFFFVRPETKKAVLDEACQFGQKETTKIILILDNLSQADEHRLLANLQPSVVVEVRGDLAGENKLSAAAKIARLAFAGQPARRQVILGRERPIQSALPSSPQRAALWPAESLIIRPKKKHLYPLLGLGLAVLVIILPFALTVLPVLGAVQSLRLAKQELLAGRFTRAETMANLARSGFTSSQEAIRRSSVIWQALVGINSLAESYYQILGVATTMADGTIHASRIGPKAAVLGQAVSLEEGMVVSPAMVADIRLELNSLNYDLGIISSQLERLPLGWLKSLLPFDYLQTIPVLRQLISQLDPLLAVWPQIVPAEGRKTYLVVFQNSAELRPTGGFIGSYGLVSLEGGRLLGWQVFDIYSADGQLRGQITPPDEILHFLGQPSWYMRDANFAADWPLTAKRLLWFLEKETGLTADGVVAVNLGAAQKLLSATGPLDLPDFNETVSAANFFSKIEAASEVNFFAGSTQKRDFLGAVVSALVTKVTDGSRKDWIAMGQALAESLEEKDILLYFNSPEAQAATLNTHWSGTISPPGCEGKNSNCLMLVEANFGANKANYFIRRSFQVSSLVDKGGGVETMVMVSYQNESPSETWPGGKYKNYLRFLVPAGSQLVDFDLGDGRQPSVSSLLTAEVLTQTPPEKFLVFQTPELSLAHPTASGAAYISFGALLEIPIQARKTVTFRYRPPYRVDLTADQPEYNFQFLKQPGTGSDLLDLSVEFPLFLKPITASSLVFPQRVIYNSDLAKDREFRLGFHKQ